MSSARAAIREIAEGLEVIDVDEGARQKFRELVSAVAATHGFDWIERAHRIAFARDLLRARIRRPVIRDRLMAMFGISRPQAYRIICHALQNGS